MKPRGKPPSLIGGGAGASKIIFAKAKRTCKWCKSEILKDSKCIEVAIPGSFGYKTYCTDCFVQILGQSRKDITNLERDIVTTK